MSNLDSPGDIIRFYGRSSGKFISDHVYCHMHKKPYNCVSCEFNSSTPSDVQTHVILHHEDLLSGDRQCAVVVDRRAELDLEISYLLHSSFGYLVKNAEFSYNLG